MPNDLARITSAWRGAARRAALAIGFVGCVAPMAAAQPPGPPPLEAARAATPASWLGSAASTIVPGIAATAKSVCELLDRQTGAELADAEQHFAKQLYDSAQLPQPYHAVLSS